MFNIFFLLQDQHSKSIVINSIVINPGTFYTQINGQTDGQTADLY